MYYIEEISSRKPEQVIRIKGRRVKKRPKRLHFDSDDSDENEESCLKEQSNSREQNKHKLYDIKHALQSKLLNTGKILSHWNENAAIDVNFIGITTSTIFNRIATTSQELLAAESKFDKLFTTSNIEEEICDTKKCANNTPTNSQTTSLLKETQKNKIETHKVENKQTSEIKFSTKKQQDRHEQTPSNFNEIPTDSQAQRIFDKNLGNIVETPAIGSSLNSWFSHFRAATKSAASVTVTHAMKTITDNAQSILKAPVSLLPVVEDFTKPEEFGAVNYDDQEDQLQNFSEELSDEPEKVESDSKWDDEWEDNWDEEPIQLNNHHVRVLFTFKCIFTVCF